MKKVSLLYTILILVGLQLVACGPTKQDPLEDYKGLNLSENPQPQEKIVYQYVDKEVPGQTINNYVPIAKETAVRDEVLVVVPEVLQPVIAEITLNEYPILVTTSNDKLTKTGSILYFFEGSESTSCINVKINFSSAVTFDYTVEGLPEGAVKTNIEDSEKEELALNNIVKQCYKYTAPPGLIGSDITSIDGKVTVSIKNLKFTDADVNKNKAMEMIFNPVSKTRDVNLMIYKFTPEIIQLLNAGAGAAPLTAAPTSEATPQAQAATPVATETGLARSPRPRARPTITQETTSSLAPAKSIRPQARPVRGN